LIKRIITNIDKKAVNPKNPAREDINTSFFKSISK